MHFSAAGVMLLFEHVMHGRPRRTAGYNTAIPVNSELVGAFFYLVYGLCIYLIDCGVYGFGKNRDTLLWKKD